jgi:predicted Zn-dependent protease
VTPDDLRKELSRRSPGQWELYHKNAESRERDASRTLVRDAWRREEGWAARWWEAGAPRFAAASSPGELARALPEAARAAVAPEEPPEWPSSKAEAPEGAPVGPPPELFEPLSRAVSEASRGEARLSSLTLRVGQATERIVNAAGLDVAQAPRAFDGVATAVGRRGSRAREARLPFFAGGEPALEALARRLADAATLPLSDRPAPFAQGQWLLDPAVGAALLAGIAPVFAADRLPRWVVKARLAGSAVAVADDASADAPFDGEGVPTRRVLLVEDGVLAGRLYDLASARRAGRRSTGHGTRPSFRNTPRAGARRIFFEARSPSPPAELLAGVRRGLFASALIAPARVDLEADRYEIEFTGVAIVAGRAQGPVAGARASGRVSELLRRIAGLSADLQFFPMPFPAGAPTILVERATFA